MENDSKSQGILLAILTAVCYGMMSIFVETFYLYGGTSGSFNLLKCIIIMAIMLGTDQHDMKPCIRNKSVVRYVDQSGIKSDISRVTLFIFN